MRGPTTSTTRSSDPPVEHVADIVRNANLFHERWGWWPMAGWLEAFDARGLAHLRDGRWECRLPVVPGERGGRLAG